MSLFRYFFFFFNDTATTEIYTLSLHDALPIPGSAGFASSANAGETSARTARALAVRRSEEHTSELQSRGHLVCRLLLEKKNIDRDARFGDSTTVEERRLQRVLLELLSVAQPLVCLPCRTDCFFFNDTATTEIYTLSLHDALPISLLCEVLGVSRSGFHAWERRAPSARARSRSEEHTSELQSRGHLVCRLLLEKKKKKKIKRTQLKIKKIKN